MMLRSLRLSVDNIYPRGSKKFLIESVYPNRIHNSDGSWGKDFDSYTIRIHVHGGDILGVKVPILHGIDKITPIADALKDEKNMVYITDFTDLELKPYAMLNDNRLVSGVSAKATDFDFEIINEDMVTL